MRQLTAPQLQSMLTAAEETRPLLLDVREPWEWQLAHIEGARLLPMGQVPASIEQIDRTRPTVVICHHGMRSLQVIAFLQRQGFDNLHNLQGGIDAWSREVDPGVALY